MDRKTCGYTKTDVYPSPVRYCSREDGQPGYFDDDDNENAYPSLQHKYRPGRTKSFKAKSKHIPEQRTRTKRHVKQAVPLRRAGDDTTVWQILTDEVQRTVSHDDVMCTTIAKKIDRHEDNAISELRVKLQSEEDKRNTPLRNRSGQPAIGKIPNERLISSKTGKPDFRSMGGVGRTHKVVKEKSNEPGQGHRVINVKSKDPDFKIGNQKKPIFRSGLRARQQEWTRRTKRILATRKEARLHNKSRGYRRPEALTDFPLRIEDEVRQKEESDSENECFPNKGHKCSASLASTSCGNSPTESDNERN